MAKGKGIDIKQLFRNKKEFADDLSIDLGNGATLTLGELRAYDEAMDGDLQKQLQSEKTKLEAERGKINKAAEEVANLYLQLEEREKGLKNNNHNTVNNEDPFAGLEGDPLAKVVKGYMESTASQLKKLEETIERQGKNLTQAGRTYMNDLVRGQFEGLRKDPDFSDEVTLDGVFDYAVKRGLKREDGIPDINEAYNRMIQPKRQERLIKEAKAEARKEFEQEQQKAAFMPPPGSFGHSIGPRDKMTNDPKQPPRTIREAVARGAQDPTIFGFKDSVN